jgi:hypothetical protein
MIVRLTNRGATACQVATNPVGTLAITRVSQDGGPPIQPQIFDPSFDQDLGYDLRKQLKTLQPGESVDLALQTVPLAPTGLAIEAITWSPLLALGFFFPVRPDRPVHLDVNYALPIAVDNAPATRRPSAAAHRRGSTQENERVNWC